MPTMCLSRLLQQDGFALLLALQDAFIFGATYSRENVNAREYRYPEDMAGHETRELR